MIEVQIDALVGPTHHFGGLGVGNVASQSHAFTVSHPRQAALEGLDKAAFVASQGIPQFLLPPPERPRLDWLERLGFTGSDQQKLQAASEKAPIALSAIFSSAFMWAANSCTVTPGMDALDGRLHLTAANLTSSWHRSFEATERTAVFERLLGAVENCAIHQALPDVVPLRDEGAANHMRLSNVSGENAINLFVHGESESCRAGMKFLARHTKAASEALARLHQLESENTFFLQQHPEALDAGVFHNDVIAMSNRNVLIHHERAFLCDEGELERIERRFEAIANEPLKRVVVPSSSLPMEDAVKSYLFNSQLLSRGSHESNAMLLVCPQQCQEIESASQVIRGLIEDPAIPIDEVHYAPLAQSMSGGGGPACLRLRLPLEAPQLRQLNTDFQATESRIARLREAITEHYPEQLSFDDFTDVDFIAAVKQASREILKCF